jgi:hypothetical protein
MTTKLTINGERVLEQIKALHALPTYTKHVEDMLLRRLCPTDLVAIAVVLKQEITLCH